MSPRQSIVPVLLLLLPLVAGLLLADPALAGPAGLTIASVDGDTIRIKTFIEISGPRATEAMAAVIGGDINGVWQDPANQQTFCGRKVEFEAEVRVAQGRGTEGWHQIYIPDLRPGQGFTSNVSGGHENAYTSDLGGTWTPYGEGDPYGYWVFAHEAGHLFGAPDEYFRLLDQGQVPNPGREFTLMSEAVPFIDMGIVNNILQNAFPDYDLTLPGCIQGTFYQVVEESEGDLERTAVLDLEIMLEGTPEGEIKGTAVGEFSLGGTYRKDDDCGFGYSLGEDIELDISATGSGAGPYKIEADLPILVEETQRHMFCDQAIDLVLEWEVGLTIDDVVFGEYTLPNGRVLQRQFDVDESSDGDELKIHLWQLGPS